MKRFASVLTVLLFTCACGGYAQGRDYSAGTVDVCYRKTSVLVFPAAIETADYGSADILVKTVKKGSNVLKVKAAKEGFAPTNLTVFTDDGKFYSLNVSYAQHPQQQVYLYDESSAVSGVSFYPDSVSMASVKLKASCLARIHHRGKMAKSKSQHIFLLLRQIYVSAGKMYFVFQLHNFSHVPFAMQYVRFFQQDAKRQKLTSHGQQEMLPVFTFNMPASKVTVHHPVTFVAVFNQFTITDHKRFVLHIGEVGGDRQQRLSLKGRKILRARQL